jgi:hypothetical protein
MIGVHVYRSRSQDIAPMTKGGCSEGNRPRDGKIKAARCAAGGRPEEGHDQRLGTMCACARKPANSDNSL